MNRLLAAAKRHYESKRDEAIANLEVYFTKAVGIGEIADEQNKVWVDSLHMSIHGVEHVAGVHRVTARHESHWLGQLGRHGPESPEMRSVFWSTANGKLVERVRPKFSQFNAP